jgi:stage IV sporulation protein FB
MMAWETRDYRGGWQEGGSGGLRAVLRRMFGDGENPLSWALPLYRAWGIQVKIHLIFIIMIIAELIWAIPQDRLGVPYTLIAMGGLFLLVLLHEYGHCFACRHVGGTADQILMWPLGGLAYCAAPHHWRADLITTVGGPGVNLVLWPALGLILLALGQSWDVLIFNPFNPGYTIGSLRLADGTQPVWLAGIWLLYYINLLLLAFNVLLPMYPMDGGRIVHALLWRRMGHRQATSIAAKLGLAIAIVIFVFAITGGSGRLVGLSIFGGITCWIELRRLKMTEDPVLGGIAGYDFDRGYMGLPQDDDDRPSRAAEKKQKKQEQEQAELDRILAKIAAQGMASLTRGEKRWLDRTSERRRAR